MHVSNQGGAPRPPAPPQPVAALPHVRPAVPYDLGIDLGTTFTAAAVRPEARPDNPVPTVRVVGLERGTVQVPSVLLVDDDGSLLVGAEAEARAPWAPQRVVREFKRRLGTTPRSSSAARASPPTAWPPRWSAGPRTGSPRATAPSPAGSPSPTPPGGAPTVAGSSPRPSPRWACTTSSCSPSPRPPQLPTPPRGASRSARTVAVYDLGGGTFDAAVVRGVPASPMSPVGLTVLGRGQGLEALGGIDFDEALFWHVCSELGGAVAALDPADPDTVRAVAGLRRACVAAKETLSVDTDAIVDVRLPNVSTRIRVTRGEFEEMIEPALRQTVDVLGEVLDSAHVRAQDLDGVLLVGGSSRIPLVARMLSAELGRPVAVDPDPTTVVARGTTWAAAAVSGAVRPAAPTSGTFPAYGSGSFPAPGSAAFPAVPHPAAPVDDDEPRTEVVGRSAALLAHARHADPDDPMTTPVRLDLRGAGFPPAPAPAEPPTAEFGISTVALPSVAASPLAPPGKPDTRRRRLAIGAGAAAVLVIGGGVAVTVPMFQTTTSSATVAAPAAPGGITAQPAAADAGTLPAGTLPTTTDPTTTPDETTARAASKATHAAPGARPAAPITAPKPGVPAPVAPAVVAPKPATNTPVAGGGTPVNTGTPTPVGGGAGTGSGAGGGTGGGAGGSGTGAGGETPKSGDTSNPAPPPSSTPTSPVVPPAAPGPST